MKQVILLVGCVVMCQGLGWAAPGDDKFILLSLDGLQLNHFNEMLGAGQLSNFEAFINDGGFNDQAEITHHSYTSTGPGHAEMLSGFGDDVTGISSNSGDALPDGLSVFEKINSARDDIVLGSIWGKDTSYVPDELLLNAISEIDWWHDFTTWNQVQWEDKPNYATAASVANKATEFISQYAESSFFFFVHFQDTDAAGHKYGENSANYDQAILDMDQGLGILITALQAEGIEDDTEIIITSDHGFMENGTAHGDGSDPDNRIVPLMSNNPLLVGEVTSNGIREQGEITPTILDYFGIDITDLEAYGCDSMISQTPDTDAPVISNVQASNVTASQATITWNTDEVSTSQVEYGLDKNYGNNTSLDANPVISHSVVLANLSPTTTYQFRVISTDASENESISQNNTFTTAVVTYSITASAGSRGQISPSRITQVVSGGSQTYDITANTGYYIWDVLVDGSSVGAVSSYSFTNVTANHTIAATFAIEITASTGSGGQISPSGATQVAVGGSQTYDITANTGYHISDVLVDGISIGAVSSYSFTNVTDHHTLAATFAIDTYTITASAGNGGLISPSGTTEVNWSGTQSYTITPNTGYHIVDVLVDGSSVGKVTSYSFTNVTSDHTIAATFGEQDVTAPTVTNLSPQAGSIQAPLNTLVILDITDSGDGVDAASVTIEVNGNLVYTGDTDHYNSSYGDCRRTGTNAAYSFVYQSNEVFDYDQTITVTVNASDLASPSNSMSNYSYSFMTEMHSFGQDKQVNSGLDNNDKPVTVCDSSGNIWAAWHAGAVDNRDIYVSKLAAGAENFGGTFQLTDNTTDQCNPAIALDSNDKLYVVWQDNRQGDWDIYSSTSVDGANWTTQTRVNDPNEGNQVNPAIVVDSRSPNYAYVAWQDDRAGNQDICIASSSNSFGTKTVSQITSNTANQTGPAIAVDSANTVYVLWTDARNATSDIYGAAGSPWTNVPIVTKAGSQSNPAIAAESAGTILHMLWVDQISGNSDIYYASSDGLPGSALAGTNLIDDTLGKEQLSPAIAVTGSTGDDLEVFACWHDERNITDSSGDTDLYMVQTNSGVGTNVFVGDGDTNSDQIEPAISTDQYGYPYLVWTDYRSTNTEIYFAGSVYLQSTPLASELTTASEGGTVGTDPGSITDEEDVSVVVPAGACSYDVTITVTKIANLPAFAAPCLGGYDFGPSGIQFSQPVTITIPYVFSGSDGSAKPYWFNSLTGALSQQGITDIQDIPISSSLHAVSFKTTHFTAFYLLEGGAAAIVGGGGGGGGGCSVSASGEGNIVEFILPYIGLAVVMIILKMRDARDRKARSMTAGKC